MLTLILAAGKGTRMKSSIPKVLHKVAGKSMLLYSIELAAKVNGGNNDIVIVVNSDAERIKAACPPHVRFCEQGKQNGTADAVLSAEGEIKKAAEEGEKVLILCGDMPNIQASTVDNFIKSATADINFISVISSDPAGYGRVVRGDVENSYIVNATLTNTKSHCYEARERQDNIKQGKIKIVEDKDATAEELSIAEVNSGIYYCDAKALIGKLSNIANNNAQSEYYLTDIVSGGARAWCANIDGDASEEEFLGINDRVQLAYMSKLVWYRRAIAHMHNGVGIVDPYQVYIDDEVEIGEDTVIYPNVYLQGTVKIGKNNKIYSGNRIVDTIIGDNNTIKENNLIEESKIADSCNVGPMAHMRPGAHLLGNNNIGNFVEVKKSIIGRGSKASHLTYLGDSTLGENVNIGCGVITCNYDGFHKYETIIEDDVFIGSDTQLIAPVRVGKGAIVAAGTTVTEDVEDDSIAISRVEQKNLAGRAIKFRKDRKKQ